ncbi:MAG TPA: hypothetical protein VGD69_13075 [Herpetosiphonaceae bacterium]
MRSAPQEETLSHRWGPGVLTALPMLAAYVGAAMIAPALYSTAPRFLLSLSVLSLVVSLIVGLIGRAAGLYAPDALGQPRVDAARQGTCSTQLALLLSWPILSSLDIHQSLWAYLIAFLLVGALGRTIFSLIAQGRNRTSGTTSGIALHHAAPDAPKLERAQVAPRWLRTAARVCFIFGLLALARLAIDREMMFLWLSLGLLAFALIAPSVAVALGFGRDEEPSR